MARGPYIRASDGWRHSLHPNGGAGDGTTRYYPTTHGMAEKWAPRGHAGLPGAILGVLVWPLGMPSGPPSGLESA